MSCNIGCYVHVRAYAVTVSLGALTSLIIIIVMTIQGSLAQQEPHVRNCDESRTFGNHPTQKTPTQSYRKKKRQKGVSDQFSLEIKNKTKNNNNNNNKKR